MSKSYWERGELKRLSIESNISQSTISAIVHRRIGVSRNRAFMLEVLCKDLFNKVIPWKDFLFNCSSTHEAFYGVPQSKTSIRKK